MNKCILSLIILLITCTVGCRSNNEDLLEHKDLFTAISTDQTSKWYNSKNTNNMISHDAEGNVVVDLSTLPDNLEGSDPEFTLFKYASDKVKTADTEEYKDVYNIANQVGNIGAVIKRIDTIGAENNFSECKVHYSSIENGQIKLEEHFIISLDYDYYVIDYYEGEGAISTHDSSGNLATEYSEIEEEQEWFD